MEDKCRIRKKIEALNDILDNVHVLSLGSLNSQVGKQRTVEVETPSNLELVVDVSCKLDSVVEISDEPPGSSRVSGDAAGSKDSGVCWKPTIIFKAVMEQYIRQSK